MRIKHKVTYKSRIPDIAAGIKPEVDKMERKIAHRVLEVANNEVPVQTGKLRDSGDIAKDGEGYAVSFDTPYAQYVHFGTRFQAANPFLTRAVNRVAPEFDEELRAFETFLERYNV